MTPHSPDASIAGGGFLVASARFSQEPVDDAAVIARLTHERGCLAEAIGNAARKAGITAPGAQLTGPMLMMLCDDLASAAMLAPRTIADQQGLSAPTYRLLTTGDVIQRGDEILSDDTLTWLPLVGWEIGLAYRHGVFVPTRRASLPTLAPAPSTNEAPR